MDCALGLFSYQFRSLMVTLTVVFCHVSLSFKKLVGSLLDFLTASYYQHLCEE